MEKGPHQEYRDDLAAKLREIRNSDSENSEIAKAKASGYLDSEKNKDEYIKSKKYHQKYIENHIFENAPAEQRVDKVLEKIRKERTEALVSREEILSGLKAIDNLDSIGVVLNSDFYLSYAFEYSDGGYMERFFGFRLGREDEYDLKAAGEKIGENAKLAEVVMRLDPYGQSEGTHVNRIIPCGGDHEGSDPFTHPSSYECSCTTSGDLKERSEKLKNFLEQFRKSPELIAKEQEEKRLKEDQKKKEDEDEKAKKGLEKFDPAI